MKKRMIYFLASLILFIFLIGCGMAPKSPDTGDETETQTEADQENENDDTSAQTPAVVPVPEAPAIQESQEPVVPVVNENITLPLKASGNLNLQDSPSLCPHIAPRFDCNRYDVRSCPVKKIVGQNDFLPGIMSCRSGYEHRGENPNHKYCFIQECRPIEKENIVEAYGGPVAYVEYIYSVEKVEGGIMTHYTLNKCGEEEKEFKTSFDCNNYMTELRNV